MEDEPSHTTALDQALRVLRRQELLAQGRYEALHLAVEVGGDLDRLRAEIADSAERMSNPVLRSGPMAPGAGPRIYREGYLAGLREAVDIILNVMSNT